jgi:hypothetical protein
VAALAPQAQGVVVFPRHLFLPPLGRSDDTPTSEIDKERYKAYPGKG